MNLLKSDEDPKAENSDLPLKKSWNPPRGSCWQPCHACCFFKLCLFNEFLCFRETHKPFFPERVQMRPRGNFFFIFFSEILENWFQCSCYNPTIRDLNRKNLNPGLRFDVSCTEAPNYEQEACSHLEFKLCSSQIMPHQ